MQYCKRKTYNDRPPEISLIIVNNNQAAKPVTYGDLFVL